MLSPRTIELVRGIRRPVELVVFMVPPDRLPGSLLPETRELVRRISRHSPLVTVQYVDPDLDPVRAEMLADKYDVNRRDLKEGGVVVASGRRGKFVASASMAEYRMEAGRRRLAAYRGEGALLEGLVAVTSRAQSTVCFTRDHGEAPTDSYADAGYGYIADEVKRDGYRVRGLGSADLLANSRACRVMVIGGPQQAFAAPETDALDRYLRRGGRLMVLLGPVLDRKVTGHRRVGLEELLTAWGIRVMDNIAVDSLAVPGEQPLMTWATRDGYVGDHPIARAMSGRITVWPLVREVRPVPAQRPGVKSQALVRTSAEGWAETDLASLRGDRPLRLDRAVDTPGPVTVAVAATGPTARIAVLGTERGVINRRMGSLVVRDHNRDLFLATLGWLDGSASRVATGPKVPEQLQLTLDERQLTRVFLISVVALPSASLLVGLFVWWRRRR